ncbi:spondin-1-like [Lycorma delicatula]|uniref:spondin-1-like n=1 Tax=Lycorma delicatula TaxID=130591 RepID=UPI003F5133E6
MQIFILITLVGTAIATCPRTPNGIKHFASKTAGDGGFKISIGLEPQLYVPGNMYSVSISGKQPFKKFLLTAEQNITSNENNNDANPQSVGSFMLVQPTEGAYSESCINTIVEIDDSDKNSVSVIWSAPTKVSNGGCILLRAMVMIDKHYWFADDERLTRKICEYTKETTPEPGKCCACDEAKYQVIFEGLWSNRTHPKDFPFMLPLTHFSDVIGGTHHNNFKFWGEGLIATDGLKQLAEWGSVGSLERELLANSRHLKTLVKASGLWYPNVNTNTSSSFKVDRSKHLLSLASMFGPSPDWIVGVSSFDLCQTDCSWLESKIIDLYPYDAGTDNGISYMSANSPTVPREPIRKITSFYPEDPRAPFYDPSGHQMKPLARLYLHRSKVIPKSCDAKTEDELLQEISIADNDEDSDRSECSVTEYSAWTACSVSCGKGLRMRQRSYTKSNIAKQANCSRQLISKEMCVADVPTCPGDEPEESIQDTEKYCKTKDWSPWSSCSASCGVGIKMRTRKFIDRLGNKYCQHINIIEKDKCMMPPCTKEEVPDPLCPTAEWTEWSPCSVSCGTGVSIRTRTLLGDETKKEKCGNRVQLVQQFTCSQEDCTFDLTAAKEICVLEEDRGPCRGEFQRWRYEQMKGMCIPFLYGGCRGNRNNFATDTECLAQCSGIRNLIGTSSSNSNNSTANFSPQDCVVSDWSTWSNCSVSCGRGIKAKTRQILVNPRNGGLPCPTLSLRRRCFKRC